jgi:hypothetical protein
MHLAAVHHWHQHSLGSTSAYLSLSIYLSIHPSIHLRSTRTLRLSVTGINIRCDLYLAISLCLSLSLSLSIYPSIHPSIHLSIKVRAPRGCPSLVLTFVGTPRELLVPNAFSREVLSVLASVACHGPEVYTYKYIYKQMHPCAFVYTCLYTLSLSLSLSPSHTHTHTHTHAHTRACAYRTHTQIHTHTHFYAHTSCVSAAENVVRVCVYACMYCMFCYVHLQRVGDGDGEERKRARLMRDANAFLLRVFSPRLCQQHCLRYSGAAWTPVYVHSVHGQMDKRACMCAHYHTQRLQHIWQQERTGIKSFAAGKHWPRASFSQTHHSSISQTYRGT